MQVGILGLPNVGKSTLFNALSKAQAAVSNYPFCTIKPNVSNVFVDDERLEVIFNLLQGKGKIPAQIKIVDLAGLIKGANQGEGLGNEFLSYVREADALIHLVRCFENKEIAHIDIELDPIRDIEIIDTELCLADLNLVEKRLKKIKKQIRSGEKKLTKEEDLLGKLEEALSAGRKINQVSLSDEEIKSIKGYGFLTQKPVFYLANVGEEFVPKYEHRFIEVIREKARREGNKVVPLCVVWEKELAELNESEREEFKKDLGVKESSLKILVSETYNLLGLITFFTAQDGKIQAWPVERGIRAKQAAGKIHSDMEKGFICAEVYQCADLEEFKSPHRLKEQGLIRTEGKDYLIADGDIVQFKFR